MQKKKPKREEVLQIGDWVWARKSASFHIIPGERYRVVAIHDRSYFAIDLPKEKRIWLCRCASQDWSLPRGVKWEIDNFDKNLEKILE